MREHELILIGTIGKLREVSACTLFCNEKAGVKGTNYIICKQFNRSWFSLINRSPLIWTRKLLNRSDNSSMGTKSDSKPLWIEFWIERERERERERKRKRQRETDFQCKAYMYYIPGNFVSPPSSTSCR